MPGLVLLDRARPLFLAPVVAYIVFKATIRRENEYLEKRFAEAYSRYKAEVNELFPLPRRKQR
jgi:protein-S-isoprenylcysteine O-methyltransferase Ste14